MPKKVIHFVRKSAQLKTAFISYQIKRHIQYIPGVCFRQQSNTREVYGSFNLDKYKYLNIDGQGIFGDMLFKLTHLLTRKTINRLIEFINKENPDILHFHYGPDAAIYLPYLKKIRKPKVISFYGYDCSGFPKRFFGLGKAYLKHRVFKHATKVFAMSPDMKKDLIASGCPEEKIIVHYYGIEADRLKQRKDYPEEKPLHLLILSGLEPQKGHLFLLEAIKRVAQTRNDFVLDIVGEGPIRKDIEAFIAKHKLKNINVPGKVLYGSERHQEYLDTAAIFVHPSVTDTNGDKEGIPGAIVESMAVGIPVISTRHAGIPYVIKNEENGLLVDEWDIEGLSGAIIRLMDEPALRSKLGKSAAIFARKNLATSVKEIELEEIYNQLSV